MCLLMIRNSQTSLLLLLLCCVVVVDDVVVSEVYIQKIAFPRETVC
jgi:hypothetical protein